VENFASRHIGPRQEEYAQMLSVVGVSSMDELIRQVLPEDIRLSEPLDLPEGISEAACMERLEKIAAQNKIFRSYIGQGYYPTFLPSVIKRNILENPSWYTSYTPYQAEISQGRLEALLNFQTAVAELTGMDMANASLLDEASAAAEAMMMLFRSRTREAEKNNARCFMADRNLFPQTLEVLQTRAEPLGIEVTVGDWHNFTPDKRTFGVMVQYPDRNGNINDYAAFAEKMHEAGIPVGVAADLMSLSLIIPPGQWGADVAVGSSQRFGIPMGYGGPHAAYFAIREAFKRNMPGRIIGISVDAQGKRALRMALQTREQHIKREKATSNICTAQALLATMAGMYAVYHGPEGIRNIAERIRRLTGLLARQIAKSGFVFVNENFFDTLTIRVCSEHADAIRTAAEAKGINFRYDEGIIGISLDETTTETDMNDIAAIFKAHPSQNTPSEMPAPLSENRLRKDVFMKQAVFHRYRSETEMMRYIKKLERRDISLTHAMIPLGSCTMKLNAATEMFALGWPAFGNIHPFVPKSQAAGYHRLIDELSHQLSVITGLDAVSFQPNSGATGEYAGLMIIRGYLNDTGQAHRRITLIPSSAHGTNPASAAMAGMEVITVPDDGKGNIDIAQLKELAERHRERLAVLMITYPSTHGVFEEGIREITDIIHCCGGQVYMDGANMNAQTGLTHPALLGADVCHLNLHKTFAIPHGGGGPGMGPVCVAKHLTPYLPQHPLTAQGNEKNIRAVGATHYGSASILTIAYAYIIMMGGEGLRQATCAAILNANYLAAKLQPYYKILYANANKRVAHEMILECRDFKEAGITATDMAKRLMDYGFHAPTLSFPVAGTLMIEPTESESLQELDRFAAALVAIREEIAEVLSGKSDATDHLLKNAPHTEEMLVADRWEHSYSRAKAAYPMDSIRENKYWPACGRIDDAFGDRNLQCVLP
jgi:glycine dehydrogenase